MNFIHSPNFQQISGRKNSGESLKRDFQIVYYRECSTSIPLPFPPNTLMKATLFTDTSA